MPADSVSGRKDLFQLVVSENLVYTSWQTVIYSITWKKSQRLGRTFKFPPSPHDLPVTLAPSRHLGGNRCSKKALQETFRFQSAWHLPRVFLPSFQFLRVFHGAHCSKLLSPTSEVAQSTILCRYSRKCRPSCDDIESLEQGSIRCLPTSQDVWERGRHDQSTGLGEMRGIFQSNQIRWLGK